MKITVVKPRKKTDLFDAPWCSKCGKPLKKKYNPTRWECPKCGLSCPA